MKWQLAEVAGGLFETPRVRTLALEVAGWEPHKAGQHIDVRLTAEDGYQAQRSYSVASPPEAHEVAITVERIDEGEVSPYLVDEARPGDQFEIRGPVGGYFVWDGSDPAPVLLIAGGSGIVPLMSMIRHKLGSNSAADMRLLYSARSYEDIIYRQELDRYVDGPHGVKALLTLTRSQPPGWTGYSRRLDAAMLAEAAWPAADDPLSYICGPTAFVEAAASLLVDHGYHPQRVKTERFGPSGT